MGSRYENIVVVFFCSKPTLYLKYSTFQYLLLQEDCIFSLVIQYRRLKFSLPMRVQYIIYFGGNALTYNEFLWIKLYLLGCYYRKKADFSVKILLTFKLLPITHLVHLSVYKAIQGIKFKQDKCIFLFLNLIYFADCFDNADKSTIRWLFIPATEHLHILYTIVCILICSGIHSNPYVLLK